MEEACTVQSLRLSLPCVGKLKPSNFLPLSFLLGSMFSLQKAHSGHYNCPNLKKKIQLWLPIAYRTLQNSLAWHF